MEQKVILSPEQIKRIFDKDIRITPLGRLSPNTKISHTCSNKLCSNHKTCKWFWDTWDYENFNYGQINYVEIQPRSSCEMYTVDPFKRFETRLSYPGRNIFMIDTWNNDEYEKFINDIVDTYEP